jgi:hypothetical protein
MKRRARRIGLLVALLAIIAAAFFAAPQSPAAERPAPLELGPVVMPIDTPPPLQPVPGWPFEELPLVAKFALPVPQIALVSARPPLVFEHALRKFPTVARPVVADRAPYWLLPLPAAAFVAGRDRVAVTVVPEPTTLFLLATGLLLLAWMALRRRPAPPPP